jgi:CRP/FNR family transcriptional regulator, cyclic AMP receptor protein
MGASYPPPSQQNLSASLQADFPTRASGLPAAPSHGQISDIKPTPTAPEGLYAYLVKFVPILRFDPDLAGGLEEPRLAAAVHSCQAAAFELPAGQWQADLPPDRQTGFGLLVLSGILCRRVVQGECYGAELVGSGDVLRPWDTIGEWSSIPSESSWTVIEPARMALLDAEFARRASPYPEVSVQLLRRGLLRSRYLATLAAIMSQRRIDTRLTMLFWHLADRFGHVRGDGVDVPVPLTHSILAELVAARRPSVTTALTQLYQRGVVHRDRHGWRLQGTLPAELLEVQGTDCSGEPGRGAGAPASSIPVAPFRS